LGNKVYSDHNRIVTSAGCTKLKGMYNWGTANLPSPEHSAEDPDTPHGTTTTSSTEKEDPFVSDVKLSLKGCNIEE
jgi:hypothetical protein